MAERVRINRIDAILISMLIGWCTCSVLSLIPDPRVAFRLGMILLLPVTLLAPLIRLVTYVGFYRDSISLWGRIRTGRWIIPGYDRCLVGPLLSLLVMPAVLLPCLTAKIPPEVSMSLSITAVILVALITPPRLKDWLLTGKHRIAAGQYPQGPNAEFIKVG